MRYLIVFTGGGIGAVTRYIVGALIMARYGGLFPVGTLFINVSGSFLIGLLMTLLTETWHLDPYWRLALVVGFLGGYTTFSSFEYETYRAVRDGGQWLGLLNIMASVFLGYLAVWSGSFIAGHR